MNSIRILIPLMFFLAGTVLHAQYSDEAFEQKEAGELYDERGFLQNKAITVDGKLVVSNSNGNVSYSYPVSSWKENGYGFSMSLNYCGSVAFSTHGGYETSNHDNPYTAWNRFSQNRPVWLLGINGFAVQSLSLATAFHADPDWITGRYENTGITTFNDDDFLWTIDGYDICNRMQDFFQGDYSESGGGSFPYRYRDVIRLLREDGSVLELLNVKYKSGNSGASDVWSVSQEFYSGYYIVNEANTPGYALVEFQEESDMPQYLQDFLPDAPRYRPRIVRYFPGDGLQYIFEERFNPYGMQDFRDALLQFGGAKAHPTIFYLTEIRDTRLPLVELEYSRHVDPAWQWTGTGLQQVEIVDSSLGRALLTRIGDDHSFTYGPTWMKISALGRTTTIRFDTLAVSGNALSTEEFPLHTFGYFTPEAGGLANLPLTSSTPYRSWVAYVTKIVDPEGRETAFDYEEYERRHKGFGFPRANVTVALKNYRLNEIIEPTAKYAIKYHNRGGGGQGVDVDGLDTLTVFQGSVPDFPYAFSNSAREVTKRSLDNTLLTTDNYDFIFPISNVSTTPSGAIIENNDEISGRSTVTTYTYQRDTLPRSIPMTPEKYFTELKAVKTVGYINGIPTDSSGTSTSYSVVAPYLILPGSETGWESSAEKETEIFFYQVDTVRRYGDDDTLIKYHGMEVGMKATELRDPLGRVHRVDSVRFINIPQKDTSLASSTDTIFDKFAMQRKFDSLRAINDPAIAGVPYRFAIYDPRILTIKAINIPPVTVIPPMFNLPDESWTSDANGNYLSGQRNVYCLFGDCDAGAGSLDWAQQLVLRGALTSDTMFGRGRRPIPGSRLIYSSLERGMPDAVVNRFGAKIRNYYFARHPGIPQNEEPTGNILANDNGVYPEQLRSGVWFARKFEVPLSERAEVRRYDQGLSLLTDTLTTMYERTHHGQISGTVDPNGWLSRYDYDYNGRLNTAWLPYDFQSPDSTYILDYTGVDVRTGYAATGWNNLYDTIDCTPNNGVVAGSTWDPLGYSGEFFVDKPLIISPNCNGGFDTSTVSERKGGSVQDLEGGGTDIPWNHRSSATATLSFSMPVATGTEILSLDSGFVDLYVSAVMGECVTVNVTMPEYETFAQSYVLNCESLPGGGGGQSGPDTVEEVLHLRINLAGYLDSIADDTFFRLYFVTTTTSAEVHFVNGYDTDDDARPRLSLYGDFRAVNPLADYTLRYEYDDANLTSTVTAKIDDSLHTANRDVGGVAALGEARRTATTHYFGADYRLLKSKTPIGPLDSPVRYDSVGAEYDGLGLTAKARDQLGDTVMTVYDGIGRPDTTWNQDGTFTTVDYYYCRYDPNPNPEFDTIYPLSCFDVAPSQQDFYGSVTAKVSTNELGKKFVEYYDAFGQLRRQVADSGGLHLITTYEYDILGRLKTATNPAGDETEYWYDDFGRVRYKQQPDLGTISYAYDDLGNVRFVQTEEQYEEDRITFNEYDDLDRLVIVGEADFFDHAPSIGEAIIGGGVTGEQRKGRHASRHSGPSASALANKDAGVTGERPDPEKMGNLRRVQSVPTDDTIDLYRITDDLDPNELHDEGFSAILTANMTLWKYMAPYSKSLPEILQSGDFIDTIPSDCEDMNQAVPDAVGPFFRHKAYAHEPTNEISTEEDFENLARHPENGRIAISYDRLPDVFGPVWETFPDHDEWDSLAPHGQIRNLKGREAAVAYREHGGEPYHYSVISYDERGRPEALLRYTENLGFDAVYYQYNSLNQVTSVTVADPFRQFTTWYGYDDNGRVDSVWTKLGNVGSGLEGYVSHPARYPATPLTRPDDAEITYVYTKTGQVDTMAYPTVSVIVDYHYSPRKWLDTLIATKGGVDLFKQELTFDAAGRITRQMSSHGGGSAYRQDYGYDAINQLTNWVKKPPGVQQTSENYAYDAVGNRESITYSGAGMSPPLPQLVYDLGRGSGPGVGPNQMLKSQEWVGTTAGNYTEYTYDPDGSMNSRKRYDATSTLTMEERFGYSSWRGLSWKYEREDPNIPVGPNIWEYRYRYNAMGEREQKREWLNPSGDGTAPGYEWTYYLLGGSKEQLSVWKGMQTSESEFCGSVTSGSYVYLYPIEYSSYAIEYNGETEDILRITTKPNGAKEYYVTDHLASVRVKLDTNGQIILSNDYSPFGQLINGQENRRLFNSREKDSECDMYNNGVRKMDADVGHFVSIDPLWESFRAWSPYQYGFNNPLGVVDPDGNQGRPAGRPSGRRGQRPAQQPRRRPAGTTPKPPTQSQKQTQAARRTGQTRENMERNSNPQQTARINEANKKAAETARQIADNLRIRKQVKASIARTVHEGKQGKHIVGHNNYQSGKSVLTTGAQQLLNDFHSGNVRSWNPVGNSGAKVRVDFGRVIGNHVDANGVSTPTTVGIIHSSFSDAHIVPAAPNANVITPSQ